MYFRLLVVYHRNYIGCHIVNTHTVLIANTYEEMAAEKKIAYCVRGYHVYKNIWVAAVEGSAGV